MRLCDICYGPVEEKLEVDKSGMHHKYVCKYCRGLSELEQIIVQQMCSTINPTFRQNLASVLLDNHVKIVAALLRGRS